MASEVEMVWAKTFKTTSQIFLNSKCKTMTMFSRAAHQRSDALAMFRCGLDAVSPKILINKALSKDSSTGSLRIFNDQFSLKSTRISLVGFGKAVAEMAAATHEILGTDLQQAILSVPLGTLNTLSSHSTRLLKDPKFRIFEGAENNLPDQNAMTAAKEILSLAEELKQEDLLLVLISGGGSALLPAPVPPITLQEKLLATKVLASAGATIQELNLVRTYLSQVKGGKLAMAAGAAQVMALILSDVIGDPIDVIASGPTFVGKSTSSLDALQIIEKYMLVDKLPLSVVNVLQSAEAIVKSATNESICPKRVHNYLIGNNTTALNNALEYGQKLGYKSVVISSKVCGEARKFGEYYARLAHYIINVFRNKDEDSRRTYEKLLLEASLHGIEAKRLNGIMDLINEPTVTKLAIISGGETTVKVTGTGSGGRNQETAMAFSLQLDELTKDLPNCSITFVSAGTDGQDGPTSAAGAIAFNGQFDNIPKEIILSYLDNNDSHSFFKMFKPNDLIVTGVTGTNVMDVHIMLLSFNE